MLSQQKFQITAHRGYKALVCENTLPAFTKAVQAGATMLELDVRLSVDQQAVLLHDTTMQRLAGDKRSVSHLTWKELKAMPLHDKRARTHPKGHTARLQDLFLELGTHCNYCVEIKYAPRETLAYHKMLCQTVCDLIRQHQLTSRCMFVCTELSILHELKNLSPQIPVGWVFEFEHQFSLLPQLKPLQAILCPRARLLTEKRVRANLDKGFSFMPWTVNRESDMQRLIDLGVMGITTDEVEKLVSVCHG